MKTASAIILILWASIVMAQSQVRILQARDTITSEWYQRIDSGPKDSGIFVAEVAAQFGVPLSRIVFVESLMTKQERGQATANMATGSYLGSNVIMAPLVIIPPTPTETLRQAIRGATSLIDLKRVLSGDEPGVPGVGGRR